jgi:citrate lyase beta subunit
MTTFSTEQIDAYLANLPEPADLATPEGQPIHVVYGGADRFNAGTIAKLGDIALRSFADNAPDAETLVEIFGIDESISAKVHQQVTKRLAVCPIEDYRVDFEDGLGVRSDTDEDEFAVNAAVETRAAMAAENLSPFFGIRIRPLKLATARRALRTLDLYISRLLADGGNLPGNFVVTLPKVTSPAETSTLDKALTGIESEFGIECGSIRLEFLAEEPRAFIAENGVFALPSLIAAANGRCRGVHLGAYDLLSSFGVGSSSQSLAHSFCDYARSVMQFSTAGLGVWLSDGATNEMPIGRHRGVGLTPEQISENQQHIRSAWRSHYTNCKRAIEQGIYQGWDLHPAQVPARLVAEFAHIAENIDSAQDRLRSYKENSERSTLTGGVFDDAATGRGLVTFIERATSLGAVVANDATTI